MLQEQRESIVLENKGEKIFSVLHTPLEPTTSVVITLHGFASHKLGTGGCYVTLAENLSREGIATLRYDMRGCGDSQGSLSEMRLEGFISDFKVVCEALLKRGFKQIGLFASSFGGAIATLGSSEVKEISSLVLWAPIFSGKLWRADFPKEHTYRGIDIHPESQREFEEMSVAKSLPALGHIPLLHMQGEKDEIVSLNHQRAFKEGRAHSSAPSRFITYPDAIHSLGTSKVFPAVLHQSVTWFKSTL